MNVQPDASVTRLGPRGTFWAFAAGLCGVWLLTHPYVGLVHDGVLYAGQALFALNRELFEHDMFFRFGSQDDFTVFSRIYAGMIALWGLGPAAMLAVLVGQTLWVFGLVRLARNLTCDFSELAWMLLLAAGGFAFYGSGEIFHYGEGFPTARLFSEALVLHALAWLVAGRPLIAFWATLVGALFHPLLALPGLVVGAFYYAFHHPRFWALPIIGILGGLGLALLNVGPFGRLFEIMDPEWFALVAQRNAYIFLLEWPAEAWGGLMLQAVTVSAAFIVVAGPMRRLALAVLLMALIGCVVSLIGGEWLRSVLIIQLQTWRSGWLLAVVANLATGMLLYRLWVQRDNATTLSALLAASALWSIFFPGQIAMITVVGLIAFQVSGKLPRTSPVVEKVAFAIAAASLLFFMSARGYSLATQFEAYTQGVKTFDVTIVEFVLLMVVLAALFATGWLHKRWLAASFAVVLLASGIVFWDRRSPEQNHLEFAAGQSNPFSPYLQSGDQIYWRRGLDKVWFILQQASYVSFHQGAGILFSRETAMTYRDRTQVVSALDPREFYDLWTIDRNEAQRRKTLHVPEYSDLVSVCQATGGPEAVVLDAAFAGHWQARWALPLVVQRGLDDVLAPPEAYYLYLCSEIGK